MDDGDGQDPAEIEGGLDSRGEGERHVGDAENVPRDRLCGLDAAQEPAGPRQSVQGAEPEESVQGPLGPGARSKLSGAHRETLRAISAVDCAEAPRLVATRGSMEAESAGDMGQGNLLEDPEWSPSESSAIPRPGVAFGYHARLDGARERAIQRDPPPMLLRLKRQIAPAELAAVEATARSLGYECEYLGQKQELVQLHRRPEAEGPERPEFAARFADLAGVAAILDRGEVRDLWCARDGGQPTVVEAAGARFGGGDISLIAGPCAVEDEARLLEVASAVAARGATLLRGGAYKPRSSPYSFQGLGRAGLEMLRSVREAVGIGVVTEVLDPRDVEAVAEVADVVQVGARSMASYALLRELGQIDKPVLLKRGFGATVSEFLGAAEYVLSGGNGRVVLCERGVRGFDDVTRNLLDVGAIAHLKAATHLPVIADPSHAAGRSDLVRALGRAGLVAGADGLMVEVHPAPEEVHSDAQQAIGLRAFEALAQDARALADLDGRRIVNLSDPAPPGRIHELSPR